MNERLKKLRKTLDLTQQAFANKLGVKRNTVGQWECGINPLTDQTVFSICREFNVNEDWLRSGTGEMFLPDPDNELDAFARKYNVTGLERMFLEKYLRLKQSERDAVVRFMLEIAEEAVDYSHGDLFSDIPDTPEELETQYPPVHPGKTG